MLPATISATPLRQPMRRAHQKRDMRSASSTLREWNISSCGPKQNSYQHPNLATSKTSVTAMP